MAELFSASTSVWSLGLSAVQVLFNAGATGARVEGAQASHEQAVARYRQAVLVAFQDVEDQLAATRVLLAQQDLRRQASEAADQVEQQVLNRYRSGQVSYTEVITAQATALSARRAILVLTVPIAAFQPRSKHRLRCRTELEPPQAAHRNRSARAASVQAGSDLKGAWRYPTASDPAMGADRPAPESERLESKQKWPE